MKTLGQKLNEVTKKRSKPNWDRIRERIDYIRERGGSVLNEHNAPRVFNLPLKPGLGDLSAGDCLINYGGFTREYTEDEQRALADLRAGRQR